MLTLSKPLSAAQLRTYHAEEFSNARGNYYAEHEQIRGHWHGRLAQQWGLSGAVHEEHVHRLADGHHPMTDAPLVHCQGSRAYTNARGDTVKAMEHRAGWDATFSAPKSVSLTALVGGDLRVAAAHRASVRAALDETERHACKPGSAGIIRRRRRGNGSPPASSMTARGPSTGTPRPNCTRTSCSST